MAGDQRLENMEDRTLHPFARVDVIFPNRGLMTYSSLSRLPGGGSESVDFEVVSLFVLGLFLLRYIGVLPLIGLGDVPEIRRLGVL